MLESLRAFEFRTEDEGIATALVDEEHFHLLCLRTFAILIFDSFGNTAFRRITMVNVLSDSIIRSLVPQRITHVFAAEEWLTILIRHRAHTTELKTIEFLDVHIVSCCILGSSTILNLSKTSEVFFMSIALL